MSGGTASPLPQKRPAEGKGKKQATGGSADLSSQTSYGHVGLEERVTGLSRATGAISPVGGRGQQIGANGQVAQEFRLFEGVGQGVHLNGGLGHASTRTSAGYSSGLVVSTSTSLGPRAVRSPGTGAGPLISCPSAKAEAGAQRTVLYSRGASWHPGNLSEPGRTAGLYSGSQKLAQGAGMVLAPGWQTMGMDTGAYSGQQFNAASNVGQASDSLYFGMSDTVAGYPSGLPDGCTYGADMHDCSWEAAQTDLAAAAPGGAAWDAAIGSPTALRDATVKLEVDDAALAQWRAKPLQHQYSWDVDFNHEDPLTTFPPDTAAGPNMFIDPVSSHAW